MNNKFLYQRKTAILLGLFLLQLGLFWPGIPVPDVLGQYNQALSGIYNDHHPAMMAFVWRWFIKIHPGLWSMYLLQLVFLYVGLWFVMKTTELYIDFKKQSWLLLLIFLIPWWPQVMLYTISIQKDNQFTFGYLMVASILANYTLFEKRLKLPIFITLASVLVYSTAVKYQAKFLLPLLSMWLGSLAFQTKCFWKKIISGLSLTCVVYAAIFSINAYLVPQSQKSNSWQYVKLFDLAAISIETNQDLIPDFSKTKHYTFEKIKEKFQPNAVDPYVFAADAILTKNTTPEEQDILCVIWRNAVFEHPFFYLKHRLTNLCYCLSGRVGYSHVNPVLAKFITPGTTLDIWMKKIIDVLGYVFFSQLPIVLLGLVYFVASLIYWKRYKLARVICGFTAPALGLIGILLFMSMAGTPRYTFFSVVMIHSCHLLAIGLYREIKRK